MSTKSELQGMLWRAQNLLAEYTRIIAICNEQIDRLKPIYDELGELKSRYKSERKSADEVFAAKNNWRGENYTTFCSDGEALDSFSASFYNQLDAAQDAVNSKIGKLKEQKQQLDPLLGPLRSKITHYKTEIQNALN